MRNHGNPGRAWLLAALALVWVSCAAPIVPQRSKPGGSARWAEALATRDALTWRSDATLCRIVGTGVGSDGWLPDRGGQWALYYWSSSETNLLQVTVDSDGVVRTRDVNPIPQRGSRLPDGWLDTPKIWATTRGHQRVDPVHTLDAELSLNAEPEKYATRVVWRVRFWLPENAVETHVIGPDGVWLGSY